MFCVVLIFFKYIFVENVFIDEENKLCATIIINNCCYVGVFVNHSYCVLALYFNKIKIEIEDMKNLIYCYIKFKNDTIFNKINVSKYLHNAVFLIITHPCQCHR